MKTIVYIDGYNLYYSLLKYSPYKWLDVFSLFDNHILHAQTPAAELLCVKYYTADIKAKFASRGQLAVEAQQRYHRALESPMTGPVQVIKGYYTESRSTPMRYKKRPDKADTIEVWKLEEKQTDVNLALDIYRDVAQQTCEQVVICSNDTDLAPALRYIKQDFPGIKIGVVYPCLLNTPRSYARALMDQAHWVRKYMSNKELAASLFADRVPTKKKPVDKPSYW